MSNEIKRERERLDRAWRDLYSWAWWARGFGEGTGSYNGPSLEACEQLAELRDAPASELVRWIFENVPYYYEMSDDRARWSAFREVAWINWNQRQREYPYAPAGYSEILRESYAD